MQTVGSPALWAGFFVFVFIMLALDLGVFNRSAHVVTSKQALRWTGVWVTVALVFASGMWWAFGGQTGLEFITGYVIEYSLSVDNIFVFIIIFKMFRIPPASQHRVLFWGILGALILRMIMIMAGAALVQNFNAVLYFFGAFLLYTGVKILFSTDEEEEEDPEQSTALKVVKRFVPTTHELHGEKFFVMEAGKRLATPLFVCLVTVEFSDVLFAVDSIPAIFAVTADPFVVFTSNIFAIMGLRSLYFLLAEWVSLFRFLKMGLGVVLSFVGLKMLSGLVDLHIHPGISLGVIVGVLVVSILASVLIEEKSDVEVPAEPPADKGGDA